MASTPMTSDSPIGSTQLLNSSKENIAFDSELTPVLASRAGSKKTLQRKKRLGVIGALALATAAIVFLVIFLPVFFLVVRKNKHTQIMPATGTEGGSEDRNPDSPTGAVVSKLIYTSHPKLYLIEVQDRR